MYKVEFTKAFIKELNKQEVAVKVLVYSWLLKTLSNCDNPYLYFKHLSGNLKDFYSHRMGDYRIIASIEDDKLIILALHFGHRKDIYKKIK